MATKPEAYEPSYEDFSHLPGIFEPDSELDKSLIDIRKKSPELFENGKRPRNGFGALRQHSKLNLKVTVIYDGQDGGWIHLCETLWLVTLDTRIRFCRWILNEHSLPNDRDKVLVRVGNETGWIFEDDGIDTADYIKIDDPMRYFLPRICGEPYYAMKFLCHFRRAEQLLKGSPLNEKQWPSLGREFFLMGELWAEISFLSEHLQNLVIGQKQKRHLDNAVRERTGAYADHTPSVLKEMERLIGQGKNPSNAARIAADKGIGTSATANRGLYYRHRKKL